MTPPTNIAGYDPTRNPAGCTFDADAAQRAVDFFPAVLTHPDDSPSTKAGDKFHLQPWQRDFVATLFGWKREDGTRRYTEALGAVPRKNGKGLSLDTPIPIPGGWTTMGQLQVGDELFDETGAICRVTFVSDDRRLDCYQMEFSNGEAITCDGDHLWTTNARIARPGRGPDCSRVSLRDTRNTREIRETLTCGARGDRNHSLSMPGPIVCSKRGDLPIDPYVLGAWLGDGSTASASITLSIDDREILQHLEMGGVVTKLRQTARGKAATASLTLPERATCRRGHGPELQNAKGRCLQCERDTDYARRHGLPIPPSGPGSLQEILRAHGLLGDKHIPRAYLRAGFSQRLALLQGLMDTDGTISKSGRVLQFCTTLQVLCDGMAELLASLGVKYSIRIKPLRCNGRDVPGVSYNLQFMAFRDVLPAFRLSRKLNRMRLSADCTIRPRSSTVQIVAVRPVPTVTTRCIQVDSPGRQFLCGRTMLPTHNTALCAGIALFGLAAEGKRSAQIYSAAMDRDQASAIYRAASRMVMQSPLLLKRLNCIDSTKRIVFRETGSFYNALSGDANTGHSKKPYFVLFDELHTQRTRGLYDSLQTGMGSTVNRLFAMITTAGWDRHSICYEVWQRARRVRDNHGADDPYFLPMLYELSEKDDWQDEAVWAKCNPNLGVSISLDFLREEFAKAKQSPAYENTFRNLYLNQWVEQAIRWLSMEAWDAGGGELPNLRGQPCWAGLDMSATTDLTAFAMVFRLDDGFAVIPHFWIPEDTARQKENTDRVPYRVWADQGFVTLTPGNQVDHSFVRAKINELNQEYAIQEIAADRWGAPQILNDLTNDGFTVTAFGQGFASMSGPSKELEKLVLARKLLHGGNPVLRWNATNVAIQRDAAENIKPVKDKSTGRIDGIVATVMGLARATAQQGILSGSLFYSADSFKEAESV